MSSNKFRVWLNNEYLPQHPEYSWIKEAYSKAVTQAVNNGQTAFTRFFNHESAFPNFKKKGRSDVKMYFVKNNPKDCRCERHRINIPSLGWVRIKEKGYIPTTKDGYVIKSGSVSIKADRFYVSVLVEIPDVNIDNNSNEGIGIDLGIKDLAICSDGNTYKNINKNQTVKKLEKRKRRLQRSVSRKYEHNKKGGSYCKTNNIVKKEKLLLKVNHRLANIRKDYLNQTTSEIVNRKPRFICIEDLNVSGMMKNRHLSKAVQNQGFFEFRKQLEYKCNNNGIQLIVADRFYPSSKLCSCCGNIKKDLKLSNRIYKCECGNVINRDFQASLNLKAYGEKFAS